MSKQIEYCCLRSTYANQDDDAYTKIVSIRQSQGSVYVFCRFYRAGEAEWSRSTCSSPDVLVKKYAYAHTDCNECKHKLVCLIDGEATITFERA